MNSGAKVVFFDLFFTLVEPRYRKFKNENDVIGLSIKKWEEFSEDESLYYRRAAGIVKEPEKIIIEIMNKFNMNVTNTDIKKMVELRKNRFKNALINIDESILETLLKVKQKGLKICLISNADSIDAMYWSESALSKIFDDAIFSYEVGYLKPQVEIYKIALNRMNSIPNRCFFVGDGGSNELEGAQKVGMKTVLMEYFIKREGNVENVADYRVNTYKELEEVLFK